MPYNSEIIEWTIHLAFNYFAFFLLLAVSAAASAGATGAADAANAAEAADAATAIEATASAEAAADAAADAAVDTDAAAKNAIQYLQGAGIRTRDSAIAERCATNEPHSPLSLNCQLI